MADRPQPALRPLPRHKLVAYEVSLLFLKAGLSHPIRDAKLRDEATRAAKGACLNIAEAAGRVSPADKVCVLAIASGEVVEPRASVALLTALSKVAHNGVHCSFPAQRSLRSPP